MQVILLPQKNGNDRKMVLVPQKEDYINAYAESGNNMSSLSRTDPGLDSLSLSDHSNGRFAAILARV